MARNVGGATYEEKITRVVDLTSVCVPPVHQERVASLCLNRLGIMDCLPRELGECFSLQQRAAFLLPESVFLRICCVPDPVDEEIGNVEDD